MNVAQLIAKKRDRETLSQAEIEFLIRGYAEGSIPDYQMSAWAMAVVLRGMSEEETMHLTEAMLHSGVVLDWSVGLPKVDKHSTGGVGDKISIILAPLLACCDVAVPMISGRGLGPTGGTLDKLESIPGFRTDLSIDKIKRVVDTVGCVITGASAEIAPADKRLYSLRDVTATVESIPLITASILSKKLAEGLDALVLDVKFGSGAFMQTYEQAKQLAQSLVNVSSRLGTKTTAILTNMNQPLGVMCGNANEILESIEVLQGGGPVDVRALTLAIGSQLLVCAGACASREQAQAKLQTALDSGRGLQKFDQMVAAQGGDRQRISLPGRGHIIETTQAGFVSEIDARQLGLAIIELGGGRRRIEDKIDYSAGIAVRAKHGQRLEKGDSLVEIYSERSVDDAVKSMISKSFKIDRNEPIPFQLIGECITSPS